MMKDCSLNEDFQKLSVLQNLIRWDETLWEILTPTASPNILTLNFSARLRLNN